MIPKQIKKLGEYDKYIHAMIVADSGFGKTVFAGTAKKALFLTTDPEGTISAMRMGSDAREWKIDSWSEFSEAYRYLRDGGIDELGIDWLIIDNISEAQNLCLKENMEISRREKPSLDEFIPTQQNYQRSQNQLKTMVKQFHDLPVNILWTAWQVRKEDVDGNYIYQPAIHGQEGALAQTIAGYMNVIGYGEVVSKDGKDVRRIWFTHHEMFKGKDRFICLGNYKDGLTVPEMQSMIESAKTGSKSSSKASTASKATLAKKPIRRVK